MQQGGGRDGVSSDTKISIVPEVPEDTQLFNLISYSLYSDSRVLRASLHKVNL